MNLTLLNSVLSTLAPVFLIIALGTALRAGGFLTEAFSSILNKLVFWVALPCMLFLTIANGEFHSDGLKTSWMLMLITTLAAVAAWLIAPLFGISKFSKGSFTQCAFRSNSAYVGLPVITTAYLGKPGADEIATVAVLVLAPCIILYNALSVLVLSTSSTSSNSRKDAWVGVGVDIVKNPLIIACVAGGAALAVGFAPPTGLARTMESLGQLAGPGALLALGASLTMERVRGSFKNANIAAIYKVAVCPLAGWALLSFTDLNADARFIALIYLACPTAVASYVMADAMKADAPLAASAVAISTVYSAVALGVVLALAGPA